MLLSAEKGHTGENNAEPDDTKDGRKQRPGHLVVLGREY